MSSSSEVDERTMREIYLPAFEKAVKDAKPYTVMCSYNQINGCFASENKWLLTDILRGEWGFDGYVMSDWGAVNDRVSGLKAGLELEMPSSGGIGDGEIVEAVKTGLLDEDALDRAVERILTKVFEYADNRTEQSLELEKDHELARHIAEQSIVLLKNESCVLPLREGEKLAVIGGFARSPRYQGGGSSHINSFRADDAVSALEKLGFELCCAEGFPTDADVYDAEKAAEAIKAAEKADKAVIFAGLPESFESEGYDRSHMRLPDCQNRLISEILRVQPNTVVLLHNGAPVEMPWLSSVKGLLELYLGGQAVGSAVANILTGAVNPSGKLAETMPVKLSDNPAYLNFGDSDRVHYNEGIFVGYRYYDAKEMPVAFPFGFGLSYTEFEYSNLRIDKESMTQDEELTVSVDIKNIGFVSGKETVQIYVRDRSGAARRPDKELKGFEKIELAPGEKKTVTFTLSKRSFAWYSVALHDWYVGSGEYELLVGSSSRNIKLCGKVLINSTQKLPLKLHLNSTLGELMKDERSRALAFDLKRRLDAHFGAPPQEDGDMMGDAIANSMPLRNLLTFGMMPKEELLARLEELNA